MSKPTILTVDDDALVSAAITRDLARQYGDGYRIVRASSGAEALSVLTRLALSDEPVALIASDQRMPQETGIERHRPRLLPAQAVGPSRRTAVPGGRRPARRLAAGQPGPHV